MSQERVQDPGLALPANSSAGALYPPVGNGELFTTGSRGTTWPTRLRLRFDYRPHPLQQLDPLGGDLGVFDRDHEGPAPFEEQRGVALLGGQLVAAAAEVFA